MKRTRLGAIAAVTSVIVGAHAHASDVVTAASPPNLAEVLEASGIIASGYLDGTYEYLSTTGAFKGGVPSRVFDVQQDSFTIHQAALTVALQPKEGFGALLNVTAGADAPVIKSYPESGGADIDLTQAFVQYATGPLTVMAGKFVTLAGAEVIAEPQDTNFSRSILFGYAVPFTHTGARAIYAVGDQLSVTLGVNNGWDQLTDINHGKTAEFGLGWTPAKLFSLVLDAYAGAEPITLAAPSRSTQRELIDVIATLNLSERLTLIANADWGRQSDAASMNQTAHWDGVAGYLNYQMTERWRTSIRAETFADPQGYRTGVDQAQPGMPGRPGQTWSELTLTFGYAPTKHAELRLEGRADHSTVAAFLAGADSSMGTGNLTAHQNSLAAQALFKF